MKPFQEMTLNELADCLDDLDQASVPIVLFEDGIEVLEGVAGRLREIAAGESS